MATAARIAFSRRPAPLEAAWMFCRGGHTLFCAFMLLSFGGVPLFAAAPPLIYFATMSTLFLPVLAITAAVIDAKASERLAFASLLPRTGSAKWLVLAPLCGAAALLIAVSTLVRDRPALVGLGTVGCSWWAIAIGRWLTRRWWALAAVPALALAPFATLLVQRAGGWAAAAAAAIGLAAVGLVLSPEVRRDVASARSNGGGGAVVGPQAAVSLAGARPDAFVTALRMWWLGAVNIKRWVLIGLPVFVVPWYSFGMWMIWSGCFLGLAATLSVAIGQTNKPETEDFLGALPLTRRRIFVGNVLPWLLPALVVPVAMIARVLLQSPRGGSLAGYVNDIAPFEIRTLRRLVPALPDAWPKGQFPMEHWSGLVSAMCELVLRGGLFCLTVFLAFAAASCVSNRKPAVALVPRWTVYLLLPVAYYGVVSLWPMGSPRPMWLLFLLTANVALVFVLAWRLVPVPTVAKRGRG